MIFDTEKHNAERQVNSWELISYLLLLYFSTSHFIYSHCHWPCHDRFGFWFLFRDMRRMDDDENNSKGIFISPSIFVLSEPLKSCSMYKIFLLPKLKLQLWRGKFEFTLMLKDSWRHLKISIPDQGKMGIWDKGARDSGNFAFCFVVL